jgi:hypothetical protein
MSALSFESNWEMSKSTPSNDIVFTMYILTGLRKILESDGVRYFNVFTDYERVAVEDAMLYLSQLVVEKKEHPDKLSLFMRIAAREVRRESLSNLLDKHGITEDEFTEIQKWFNDQKLEV